MRSHFGEEIMIIVEEINHISLAVSNLEKSLEFFRDVFYFDTVEKKDKTEAYLMIGDIKLRLKESADVNPNPDTYVSFNIDMQDFDDVADELEDKKIDFQEIEDKEDGPKIIFSDPDGNKFAISYKE
jgi:catechol 2,3-dioxygenase-like lactoylglutathione lyase family enzyme